MRHIPSEFRRIGEGASEIECYLSDTALAACIYQMENYFHGKQVKYRFILWLFINPLQLETRELCFGMKFFATSSGIFRQLLYSSMNTCSAIKIIIIIIGVLSSYFVTVFRNLDNVVFLDNLLLSALWISN